MRIIDVVTGDIVLSQAGEADVSDLRKLVNVAKNLADDLKYKVTGETRPTPPTMKDRNKKARMSASVVLGWTWWADSASAFSRPLNWEQTMKPGTKDAVGYCNDAFTFGFGLGYSIPFTSNIHLSIGAEYRWLLVGEDSTKLGYYYNNKDNPDNPKYDRWNTDTSFVHLKYWAHGVNIPAVLQISRGNKGVFVEGGVQLNALFTGKDKRDNLINLEPVVGIGLMIPGDPVFSGRLDEDREIPASIPDGLLIIRFGLGSPLWGVQGANTKEVGKAMSIMALLGSTF
jgi:hypothetical protein